MGLLLWALAALIVAGCVVPLLQRGALSAVESVLLAGLTGAVVATVAVSWGLLASLGVTGSSFVALVVAGVVLAASRRAGSHGARTGVRQAWGEVVEHPLVWGFTALVVLAQLGLTAAMLWTVGDVGWDAATYHLPLVGAMLQEGSLFGFPELRPWLAYPALVEIQGALLGDAFGSVRAASFVQVAYWAWLVAFVTAVLARRVRPALVVAAVAVVAAVPTLWLQTRTLYVDLAFGTVLVAAVVVLAAAWDARDRWLVVVAATLTGALLGIKLGALAALPLAAGVGIAAIWRARMRAGVIAVVALGLVTTTPYLLRNLAVYDNPTYPVDLAAPLDPVDSPPGYAPYSLTAIDWYVDESQRPPSMRDIDLPRALVAQYVTMPTDEFLGAVGAREGGNPALRLRYDSREGGFGLAWLWFVLLGAIGAATGAGRELFRSPGERTIVVVALVTSLAGVVITQSAWWPRFTLGYGVLAVVAAAFLLERVRRPWLAAVASGVAVVLAGIGLVHVETGGGLSYWRSCEGPGCVTTDAGVQAIRDHGLSGLTLEYEPLVVADPSSVAVVATPPTVGRPYFPVGLWAPDWAVEVREVEVGAAPDPTACHDAYVADVADLAWTQEWLAASDADGTFREARFDDRGTELAFLLRETPCA